MDPNYRAKLGHIFFQQEAKPCTILKDLPFVLKKLKTDLKNIYE